MWRDQAFTTGKHYNFFIERDIIREDILEHPLGHGDKIGIELSLLDKDQIPIVIGNSFCEKRSCTSIEVQAPSDDKRTRIMIAPFLRCYGCSTGWLLLPKTSYHTIVIKIARQDLPSVKASKLEIKDIKPIRN